MTFIVSAAATAASGAAIAAGATAGGLAATAAGVAGGALAGAAGGAALGAGTAAIQGKDPGQGALMGAATGAIGGGIGGGVIGNGVNAATTGVGQTTGQVAGQTTGQVAGQTTGQGVTLGTAEPATNFVPANLTPIEGAANLNMSPAINAPSGISNVAPISGNTNIAMSPVNGGITTPQVPVEASIGVPPPSVQTPLQQGIAAGKANTDAAMNWVGTHKGESLLAGATILPMLGGGGSNNGTEYQPDNTNYLSSNFQRTAPVSGYASGGILSKASNTAPQMAPSMPNRSLQPQQPMNPIVANAIQQAQQAQQTQGPMQAFQGPNAEQQMRQAQQQQPQNTIQTNTQNAANGGIMQAHESSLGGYAHGGVPRLLQGPGDGISDDIPAVIANKQPARLADGEFVVPARIVSELGNGSTEAGGKILQAMVDRVQARRAKTIGKGKVAVNSRSKKDLPA